MNRKIEEIINNSTCSFVYVKDRFDTIDKLSNLLDKEMVKFLRFIEKQNEIIVTMDALDLLTLYKAEMNKKKCG